MDKNILFALIAGVLIGAIVGFAFSNMQKSETEINKTAVDYSVKYINRYLLKPGVKVEVKDIKKLDVYALNVEFVSKNSTLGEDYVYITSDGKTLILNSIDITKEPKNYRTNVSADDDPYRGKEDAKVTIIEFSDYACPYCAKFEKVLSEIEKKYPDIKIVFRDFPIHGNVSIIAAKAANCANEQNRFWEYHDLLFEKQNEWIEALKNGDKQKLYLYAEELGLNLTEFKSCLNSNKYDSEIQKDYFDGLTAGVSGTPTVFLNGIKVEGLATQEALAEIIEQEAGK
ncbi:DsbA family protein [Archaeoglobus sulfaticallidus]|nr:DsbA family protein [Archaeoglobus sulfaticallidus]